MRAIWIVADDAGVVIVPREQAAAVLAEARKIDAGDSRRKRDIEGGVDLATLNERKYK